MRRRLVKVGSVLSLLLCVAIVALWVESYWANRAFDWIIYQRDEPKRPGDVLFGPRTAVRFTGNSCYGWFHLTFSGYSLKNHMEMPNQPTIKFYCFRKLSEYQRRLDGAKFGARWTPVNQNPSSRGGSFAVVLPYWVPTILFGFLAAMGLRWWRKWWLSSRAARRLCARCGYDLRATPDRCPECGSVPYGEPATAA